MPHCPANGLMHSGWIPRTPSAALAIAMALFGCSTTMDGAGPAGDGDGDGNGSGSGGSASGGSSGASGATQGGSAGTSGASGGGASGAAGTSGTGGEPPLPPDEVERACTAMNGMLNEGLTRLRRMTRVQFNNTVRDLVGASGTPADAISPDERIGPFASNAIAPVTDLVVEQHMEVAAALARDAQARMATLSPCDLAADSGTTCATRFVNEFGLRAYRRPLEPDEVTRYVALYNVGKQGAGGAANGFRLVVEAMLQAPSFLYHPDAGAAGTPSATPVPLTGYELASRLSYFLWNSMPDAALFGQAASGAILDPATITAEVERLLNDPKASATIGLFHRQWLQLDDLASKEQDVATYPLYSTALVDAMLEETTLFSDYVIRQGDALLGTLLTSNLAFPRGDLFDVYGAVEPANYQAGTAVPLDPSQRAGILTQAAFLTRHAHRNQTSPVHRGIIVRENILCQPLEPPPPDVNAVPPPPTESTTTRERFAQHSADPTCAGCHVTDRSDWPRLRALRSGRRVSNDGRTGCRRRNRRVLRGGTRSRRPLRWRHRAREQVVALGRSSQLRRRSVVPFLARTDGNPERRLLDPRHSQRIPRLGRQHSPAHGSHRNVRRFPQRSSHRELAP